MSDPFIAQITMFGGNFAPRGWAFCDGQLLPISQNTALFSILGTTYGGDGRVTFGLPDLRGRVSIHTGGSSGTGPGLSTYNLGQKGGAETVELTTPQLPSHSHPLANNAIEAGASQTDPAGHALAEGAFYAAGTPDAKTLPNVTSNAGGGQAHENRQPYQCVNYIIALQGIFPSRS